MENVDGTKLTLVHTITYGDIAIISTIIIVALLLIAVILTKSNKD